MSDIPPEIFADTSLNLPPVREFSDRTTLWLLEDPLNLRDLLRIYSPELTEHLDFSQAQRINRSFIPADLQKEECDLLFRVPYLLHSNKAAQAQAGEAETKDEADAEPGPPCVWIYLLLEHQSKPDNTMPLRLLSYMLEVWTLQQRGWKDQNTPLTQRRLTPVVPFVFYTGEDRWDAPLSFGSMFDVPPGFERFIPGWETLFLNLHQTPPETLTSFLSAIGWALRGMQAQKAPYEEIERTLRDAMAGLEGLSEEQFGQWLRAAWYLVLLVNHRRPPGEGNPLTDILRDQAHQSKFFAREETAIMYSYADSLIDQGIEKGRTEGRTEGAQLSLRAILEQILVTKFGALPETVTQTIAAADLDTLNGWVLAAAVANTLAEVGISGANQSPE